MSKRFVIFIFAAALIVRVAYMLLMRSWNFPSHWVFAQEEGLIGQALAEGQGFTLVNLPTAKFPPVYPVLIGAVFTFFGEYSKAAGATLLIFQSICAGITAVCLAIIGSRLFSRKVGIIAGSAWALYPSSFYFSVRYVWQSELALMLIFLIMTIAISVQSKPSFTRMALLGGLGGLLALTDSAMTIYLGSLLIWLLIYLKVGFRESVERIIVWTLTIGVVVMPWAVRNWIVLGSPGVLKTNIGLELFFGNNPYSSGGILDEERFKALAALDPEQRDRYENQGETAYYGYLQDRAIEWIRTHPGRFVQLTILRFWQFWGKFTSSGPDGWRYNSWLHLVWYVPCVLLALFGFWYSVRRGAMVLAPIWLFLLVYPLPYYVTHVQQYRYRYPVEPFLVLLAAVPIKVWLERYQFVSWLSEKIRVVQSRVTWRTTQPDLGNGFSKPS